MPTYVVQCYEYCTPEQVEETMDDVQAEGGIITGDFIATKSFWVESKADISLFLESHKLIRLIEETEAPSS